MSFSEDTNSSNVESATVISLLTRHARTATSITPLASAPAPASVLHEEAIEPPVCKQIRVRSARYARTTGEFTVVLSNGFKFSIQPKDFPELDGEPSHQLIGLGATESGDAIEIESLGFRMTLAAILDRYFGNGVARHFLNI